MRVPATGVVVALAMWAGLALLARAASTQTQMQPAAVRAATAARGEE